MEFTLTADEFRKLALSLPETTEKAHMGHPDFRVRGKIFATLNYPNREWGMVKLAPAQQLKFVKSDSAFVPVKGKWGKQGSTNVHLRSVSRRRLGEALETAWRNAAPKTLLDDF
jgi:hypothetical protein